MRIPTLFLLFLFACCLSTTAQHQITEDDLLRPSRLLEGELTAGRTNQSVSFQKGKRNKLSIHQDQAGSGQAVNLAQTHQQGRHNQIQLSQQGTGNQTAVIQQGNKNVVNSTVAGQDNRTLIVQQGNRNRVDQDIQNSSEITSELIQVGNDNHIIQELNARHSKKFKIIQHGNNLKATIRQN